MAEGGFTLVNHGIRPQRFDIVHTPALQDFAADLYHVHRIVITLSPQKSPSLPAIHVVVPYDTGQNVVRIPVHVTAEMLEILHVLMKAPPRQDRYGQLA